jgi:hypothetical protein
MAMMAQIEELSQRAAASRDMEFGGLSQSSSAIPLKEFDDFRKFPRQKIAKTTPDCTRILA